MDIETTSRLAGQFCWVETQLFEMLGTWLHDDAFGDDDLVRIGERCTRHGEYADAWRARIAAIPTIQTDALIAPSPAHVMPMNALRSANTPAHDRLSQYDAFLADHVRPGYEHLRHRIDARLDGATARLLDRALASA